jgi:hypothetical protein
MSTFLPKLPVIFAEHYIDWLLPFVAGLLLFGWNKFARFIWATLLLGLTVAMLWPVKSPDEAAWGTMFAILGFFVGGFLALVLGGRPAPPG